MEYFTSLSRIFLLTVNISKESHNFLKTLLNLGPSSSTKPHIKLDISSFLNNADSDLEDEEIFKKSQALGLSIKKFFSTITTSTLSSTTTTAKTSHTSFHATSTSKTKTNANSPESGKLRAI